MKNFGLVVCLSLLSLFTSEAGLAQRFSPEMLVEQFRLAEQNVVLLENMDKIIPLQELEKWRIAYVPVGFETVELNGQPFNEGQTLQDQLSAYTRIDVVEPPVQASEDEIDQWLAKLTSAHNLVILGIKNYTLAIKDPLPWKAHEGLIAKVCEKLPSIGVVVGRRPGADWPDLQKAKAILTMSHTGLFQQSIAAQIIFGGMGAEGKLPFYLSYFPQNTGITTQGGMRFSYVLPEMVGMDGKMLEDSIKTIVEEGIAAGAYPGAQVLVAKDGKIVYHETFGYHTYNNEQPVKKDDLYDFASITKVTGPLPALMKLYDEGKFKLDAPLKEYINIRKRSNKADLSFRQMLAHNARLRPYIPYWVGTLKSSAKYPWQEGWNVQAVNNGDFRGHTFRQDSTRNYNIRITDNLWLHRNYRKKMYKAIDRSPLLEKPGYVYSGLLFFMLPEMIEDLSGTDYETYIKQNFYYPLGAYTLTYNPMKQFPLSRIIPTENDTFFRHEQVWGSVHDEGAAMMAGVSGNAGLFGSTIDLAKLMQMYLNYGSYGGRQFVKEATMKEFTRCQYCDEGNRRGLGFDKKPEEYPEGGSYMAESASSLSFGHTGFTGTFTWADPENGLLILVMTNRVYPTRDRQGLAELSIRPRLHQVIYDSLNSGSQTDK